MQARSWIPSPDRSTQGILGAALFLYITELVLWNRGFPLEGLQLGPEVVLSRPWVVVTHWFVQGRASVISVLVGLYLLAFILPLVGPLLQPKTWRELVVLCTITAALPSVVSAGIGPVADLQTGAFSTLYVLLTLYGLLRPKQTLQVLPKTVIPASLLVWIALFLPMLFFVGRPSLDTLEPLVLWLTIRIWWDVRGPGARKRHLHKRGQQLESWLDR